MQNTSFRKVMSCVRESIRTESKEDFRRGTKSTSISSMTSCIGSHTFPVPIAGTVEESAKWTSTWWLMRFRLLGTKSEMRWQRWCDGTESIIQPVPVELYVVLTLVSTCAVLHRAEAIVAHASSSGLVLSSGRWVVLSLILLAPLVEEDPACPFLKFWLQRERKASAFFLSSVRLTMSRFRAVPTVCGRRRAPFSAAFAFRGLKGFRVFVLSVTFSSRSRVGVCGGQRIACICCTSNLRSSYGQSFLPFSKGGNYIVNRFLLLR